MAKINDIDNFLSKYSEQVYENALQLRKVILKQLPDVIEQLDLPAKMIAYCYGQKYGDMICVIIPSQKGVKLGFSRGAELSDPEKLLEGKGKFSRHIEIKTLKDINLNAVNLLLKEAFKFYKTSTQKIEMTTLFKKLNFKEQKEICVINHPKEFESEMKAMKGCTVIKTNIKDIKEIEFILTFVKTKAEIDSIVATIQKKLKIDGIVWFAYPKGTSKKYKAEINRDNGWESLGKLGFETVRAVAIDNDWSALRFRKVEFIKTMKRSEDFALTKDGREKIKNSTR